MKTEIFHPNVRKSSPNDICTGDYWAPGETLTDVIYLIGEMIQYQNYNVNNPLNGVAAKWAKENSDMFPVGNQDLRLPEIQIDFKN
jgi:ubiquitin-protein ligase